MPFCFIIVLSIIICISCTSNTIILSSSTTRIMGEGVRACVIDAKREADVILHQYLEPIYMTFWFPKNEAATYAIDFCSHELQSFRS